MEDSQRYERFKYAVSATGFVLNAALLIVLYRSGWTIRIRDFASSVAPAIPSVVVLVYFTVLGVLFTLLQIPFDFLSDYFIEHRFGLSRQSLRDWIVDQVKGLALGSVL